MGRGRAWWAGCLATLVLAAWGGWHLWRGLRTLPGGPPALPAAMVGTPAPSPVTTLPGLSRSAPVKLWIKSINLRAWIDQIGLAPDGTMRAPSYARADHAAWYRLGPAPGEVGPAVIVGHVDSRGDVAVFFYLSRMRPGDKIEITRADGRVVTFTTDSISSYAKTDFPTQLVYGATSYPALRLITCGGDFDRSTGNYVDDVVVFAHLSGVT